MKVNELQCSLDTKLMFFKNILFCVSQKKVIHVLNNMRVSTFIKILFFGWIISWYNDTACTFRCRLI